MLPVQLRSNPDCSQSLYAQHQVGEAVDPLKDAGTNIGPGQSICSLAGLFGGFVENFVALNLLLESYDAKDHLIKSYSLSLVVAWSLCTCSRKFEMCRKLRV